MNSFKLITIVSAMALLLVSCQSKVEKPREDVTFYIDAPVTKAFNDGLSATLLYVQVFDVNHTLLQQDTFIRKENGWEVALKLVPGVYSFTFWACSEKADAFTFENEYMTLSYGLMDMNSDNEDAYWASIADRTISSSFSERVTLKRPFAYIQLVSNAFINENLDGATSAFRITGAMSTKMNLITGESGEAVRKAIFTPSLVSDYTIGRRTVAAMAYVLVPENGITAAEVNYRITFKDGRYIDGTVNDVPLERNHKTTLSDH